MDIKNTQQYCWLLLISLGLIYLYGCGKDESIPTPDVSHINLEVTINRFDQEIFNPQIKADPKYLDNLQDAHPDFTNCFLHGICRIPLSDTTFTFRKVISEATTTPIFKYMDSCVNANYEHLDWLESELTAAFKLHKYYFPTSDLPSIYSCLSDYTADVFICSDSTIGISLEMFLGNNHPMYAQHRFPQYMTETYTKEFIASKVLKILALDRLGEEASKSNLISQMIHNGKVLYFLDRMLPQTPDYCKIGFTKDKMAWANTNMGEAWAMFKEKGLLFESSKKNYLRYVNPAPNTVGMPKASPGNMGSYLGWQIVRSYMKNNEVTLNELLQEQDAQKILNKAKFKPRR